MELDKRVKEGRRPLTCFDLKEASDFIEKTGYFTNELDYFSDLSEMGDISGVQFGRLLKLNNNKRCAFKYLSMDGSYENSYRFFLPEDWVLPKEKKYRPFTLDEFVNKYSLGDEIILKIKENNKIEHKLFIEYTEDAKNINDRMNICLGGFYYSFKDLFDKSELYTSEGWKPFGVEE